MAKHTRRQGMLLSSSPDRVSKATALGGFINSYINTIKISGVWGGGKGWLLFNRLISTFEHLRNNTICLGGPSWWQSQIKKWDLEAQRKLRTAAAAEFRTCKRLFIQKLWSFLERGVRQILLCWKHWQDQQKSNADHLHQTYLQTSAWLLWELGYKTVNLSSLCWVKNPRHHSFQALTATETASAI